MIACAANPTGGHCFCLMAPVQHPVGPHKDEKCCWCGMERCVDMKKGQRAGHGPLSEAWVPHPSELREAEVKT